jgi:pyrroline-5-carboxylate reductase
MPDPLLPGPLWLAGCGNMAGAMLARWIEEGVDPAHVSVIRLSGAAWGPGVRVTTDYPEDEVPAIVMLGMKPYQIDIVAPALAPILDEETILVSILAGVELASLRARFAKPRTIIRAMPNLPVRIGKGAIGLVSDSPDMTARMLISGLMATLGHAEWFDDETAFQLAGHLTGAGPAFLFRFIDALAAAAERLGLPFDQAQRLALKMVEGAAALAAPPRPGLRFSTLTALWPIWSSARWRHRWRVGSKWPPRREAPEAGEGRGFDLTPLAP